MYFPSREEVNSIRQRYPEGSRVELVFMDDPWSKLSAGDKGTVRCVDDAGTVHVNWDCGSSLGVVIGVDSIRKIK